MNFKKIKSLPVEEGSLDMKEVALDAGVEECLHESIADELNAIVAKWKMPANEELTEAAYGTSKVAGFVDTAGSNYDQMQAGAQIVKNAGATDVYYFNSDSKDWVPSLWVIEDIITKKIAKAIILTSADIDHIQGGDFLADSKRCQIIRRDKDVIPGYYTYDDEYAMFDESVNRINESLKKNYKNKLNESVNKNKYKFNPNTEWYMDNWN